MFGAVGSVHAWERVGAAITHLARVFLKMAILRYVDDLFGPERFHLFFCVLRASLLMFRLETMEHAASCLEQLTEVSFPRKVIL